MEVTNPNLNEKQFIMEFLYFIIVGAISGWLAGQVMKGGGYGLLWNILLGIIGGVVGGWLLGMIGLTMGGGTVGYIITSVIGAVVVLFVAGLLKK